MHELEPILAHYPPDLRPTQVEALGSAGGYSGAVFWRCSTARGLVCVRRWPDVHPTVEGLQFIHKLLAHVGRAGTVAVPVPLRTVTGDTFVTHEGHLWELAPWLSGAADYAAAPNRARLVAAMRTLAEFHHAAESLPGEIALPRPSPGVADRLRTLQRATESKDELSAALDICGWAELAERGRRWQTWWPRFAPQLEADLRSLADTRLPMQPCLRDVWHSNVLFDGDRVTGLIDFGAARIDSVAGDVARLLGSLDLAAGDGPAGLAAYTDLRPLSDDEHRLAATFDRANMLLAVWNWLAWIALERRSFADRAGVLGRLDVCLNRLERWAV